MAEFPALPLFTDAYLADTRHLTTEEHGAYLLLMMEAWRRPECCLPDDDHLLARLAGLDAERWSAVRQVIMAFWKRDGRRKIWTQKRLAKERSFVMQRSASQRDKAAKRWNNNVKGFAAAQPKQSPADTPTPTPPPTPISKIHGGGSAQARDDAPPDHPSSELTLRERLLATCGVRDLAGGFTGHGSARLGTGADMLEAKRWITDLGLTDDEVVSVVVEVMAAKRDGPPSNFRYFRQSMQRLAADKAQAAIPIPSQEEPHAVERHQHPRHPARGGNPGRGGAVESMLAGFAEAARSGPGVDP